MPGSGTDSSRHARCWPPAATSTSTLERHYLPAIDHHGRAGHEPARIGGEQQEHAVEIARLTEAAERDVADDRGTALAREIIAVHLGRDPSRRDRIGPDAAAGKLERERAGE